MGASGPSDGRATSLARAASPLLVGQLTSAALTFALPLLLARALDASAFGTYKQLFLVAQTVLLCCQLGLTQSLYFFLPREREGRGAYVTQALLFLAFVSVAAGAFLAAAAPLLARHLGDGSLAALSTPLALLSAGMLLGAPLEGALTSEGRVGLAAIAYVLSDGSRAALLLFGTRAGGLAGLAWAAVAWTALRIVGLGVALLTRAIPTARPSAAAIRTQASYALPFAGAVLLYVAQKQFVQYAVAARYDSATYAVFSVAAFHLPVVDILYTPITEVLMVQLGRAHGAVGHDRASAWDDAVEKLAWVLWPATICAFLFGADVLPMLFTTRYAAAVPLFFIASIEIPLWVFPVDAVLRAAGRTRFLFVWYALRLPLTAAAVTVGMRWFGVAGAIAGGALSELVSRVVLLCGGRTYLGLSLRRLLDPSLAWVALAALTAALPAIALRRVNPGRGGLLAAIVVYALGYVAVLYTSRALRPRTHRFPLSATS